MIFQIPDEIEKRRMEFREFLEAEIQHIGDARDAFGKPIGSHQMVQDMIADMVIALETSRLVSYRAAALMDRRQRCDLEQAVAKAYACEVVNDVTAKAIQVLGARGLTTSEGFRTERFYRDARFLTIAEGTTQIMKLIIGRKTLGMSAIR